MWWLAIAAALVPLLLAAEMDPRWSQGADIRVAVDNRMIFGYLSLKGWNSTDLFDIRVIKFLDMDAQYFQNEIDVTVIDRPMRQHQQWKAFDQPRPLSYSISNIKALNSWDNKMVFKKWMIDNGFENFVLKALDPSNITSFPVVMKVVDAFAGVLDHVTSGKSVFILNSYDEIAATVKAEITQFNVHKPDRKKKAYFLEPALTGTTEMTFYAAAYEGELLSLRCLVRMSYGNSEYKVISKAKYTTGDVACGTRVRNHAAEMVRRSGYTGIYCVDTKFQDGSFHPYYVDNNPRICGTFTKLPRLFLSGYLPLAFAIQKANCLYRSVCYEWFTDQTNILNWIVHVEKQVALTGDSAINTMTWGNKSSGADVYRFVEFLPSNVVDRSSYFVDKELAPLKLEKLLEIHHLQRSSRKKSNEPCENGSITLKSGTIVKIL